MSNIYQTKMQNSDSLYKPIFLSDKIVNPRRDWKILVTLCAVLIMTSIGFDYCMYKWITNEDMYVSINTQDLVIEHLKSDDLKKILTNFEIKKTNVTTLKLKNSVDPSL